MAQATLTVYRDYAGVHTAVPVPALLDIDCTPEGVTWKKQNTLSVVIVRWNIGTSQWEDISTLTPPNNIFTAGDKAVTKLTSCDGSYAYVGENVNDVTAAQNQCCTSATFNTVALVAKTSSQPLTPGVQYPCGTEACFMVSALFGPGETRTNLKYTLKFVIVDAANDVSLNLFLVEDAGFTTSDTRTLCWPEDFIGLTSQEGFTLVSNDTDPVGVNEMRILDFDYGTITSVATIVDGDLGDALVSNDTQSNAIPLSDCEGIFQDIFDNVFY